MSVDTELVAIGIALLGIILGTWTYLRRIDKKLDKLLLLAHKSYKKEEGSDHTNGVQTDSQHSLTNTVRRCIKKCVSNLRSKVSFYDEKQN